jgi:hypothetical protein
MDRELYDRTELEIIAFQTDDVITTSGREEDELSEVIK